MRSWYYRKGEEIRGPLSDSEIQKLARVGELAPGDPVTNNRMDGWYLARDISGFEFPEPVVLEAIVTEGHRLTSVAWPPSRETEALQGTEGSAPPVPTASPGTDTVTPPAALPPEPETPPAPDVVDDAETRRQMRRERRERRRREIEAAYAEEHARQPDGSNAPRGRHVDWGLMAKVILAAYLASLLFVPLILWQSCRYTSHQGGETASPRKRSQLTTAAAVLGKYLALECPSSTVLILTDPPTTSKYDGPLEDAIVAELQAALGDRIVVRARDFPRFPEELKSGLAEPDDPAESYTPPLEYWFRAEILDQVLAAHPDCDLVISLIGLPADFRMLTAWREKSRHGLRLAVLVGSVAELRSWIETGRVVAAVDYSPGPKEGYTFVSAEVERRFRAESRLVNGRNVTDMAKRYPGLFSQ